MDREDMAPISLKARRRGFYAFCAALGIFTFALSGDLARGPDWECYYCHLASLILDGDLAYENQMPFLGQERCFITSRGRVLNHASIGPAIFWEPFFLAGHVWARAFGSAGIEGAAGFSNRHFFWVNVSSWAFAALTLLLAYRAALQFATAGAATLASIGICLGTPFFCYVTFLSPSAHNTSMLLTAVIVFLWLKARQKGWGTDYGRWALLGLVVGLAVCQRTQNVSYLIPCAGTLLGHWWRGAGPEDRPVGHRVRVAASGVLFAICAVVGYASQVARSHYMTGAWWGVPRSHLGHHSWLPPNVGPLLFSSYNGAYFWSPILLLATVGFFFLWRRDRSVAAALLAVFAADVYVAAGHIAWWGGYSFGCRYLLNCTPVFIVALACLLDAMPRRWGWIPLACCAAWTSALLLQSWDEDGAIYRSPTALLQGQWEVLRTLPQSIWAYLRQFWLAATAKTLAFWLMTRIAGAAAAVAIVVICRKLLSSKRLVTIGMLSVVCVFDLWVIVAAVFRDRPVSRHTARRLIEADVDLYDLSGTYFEWGAFLVHCGDEERAKAAFRQSIATWPQCWYAGRARKVLRAIERQEQAQETHE